MGGVILVMLDGIGADGFARHLPRMPYLGWMASRGMVVERLEAPTCATSFPGRVSILTGTPPSENGVYGNVIWDGQGFRHAGPDDVRTPTVLQLAREAGLRGAAIGFGMVRPEEAEVFLPPWWAGSLLQRARDAGPVTGAGGWERVWRHQEPRLEQSPLLRPALPEGTDRFTRAALGDKGVFEAVAAALAGWTPDLLLTEALLPDTAQHYGGYDSSLALWAFSYVDSLLGGLLRVLQELGLAERYTLVVLSDHGHGPIQQALNPSALIPGTVFYPEGSVLHVAPRDAGERARVAAALAAYGAEPLPNGYLPEEQRGAVCSYLAPEGCSFEDGGGEAAPLAAPKLRSSHGFRPGHPLDERFMVVFGPGVPRRTLKRAGALQVAPTLLALLGLPQRLPAEPLI